MAARDWYTNEAERSAAHLRPESTDLSIEPHPSASASRINREALKNPTSHSVLPHCSIASAMLSGTNVHAQDFALYKPKLASDVFRPRGMKKICPAKDDRCDHAVG
jgi:hypothetical protein